MNKKIFLLTLRCDLGLVGQGGQHMLAEHDLGFLLKGRATHVEGVKALCTYEKAANCHNADCTHVDVIFQRHTELCGAGRVFEETLLLFLSEGIYTGMSM